MKKSLYIHAAETGGFALFDGEAYGINPPPFAVTPSLGRLNEVVTLFFAEAVQVGDALGKQAEASPYDNANYDVFEKAGEVKSSVQRAASSYVMEARLPNGKSTLFGFMDRDYAHAAADMVRALGGHVFFSKHRDASFGNFDELSRPGDVAESDPDPADEAAPAPAPAQTEGTQGSEANEVYVVTFGPASDPAEGMVVHYNHDVAQAIVDVVAVLGGTATVRAAQYL